MRERNFSHFYLHLLANQIPMKKLLIITLLLISWGVNAQTQATSANQQIEIGKLQLLLNQMASGITVTTSAGSGTFQLTNTTSSVTATGTCCLGARGILLETSGDFSGIIDGNRFLGNGFLSMPMSSGAIYPTVSYTVSAGTLYIRKWQ